MKARDKPRNATGNDVLGVRGKLANRSSRTSRIYAEEFQRLALVREWIKIFAGLIGLAYAFASLLDRIL